MCWLAIKAEGQSLQWRELILPVCVTDQVLDFRSAFTEGSREREWKREGLIGGKNRGAS